jgi:molybdopterin synthase sulfur carrier subunit
VAVILLPGILAEEAGGRRSFELDAASVEEALRALPVADRLFDEHGALRPLVNVYVDGIDVRDLGGLGTSLGGGETVRLVGAVAGG